jgi:hypothetical protein
MVEEGLLKRTRSALESGAAKALEKGSQEGLGPDDECSKEPPFGFDPVNFQLRK